MGAVETGPHAESIPFNNLTNGFTADRVQPAIEEAKAAALGLPRGFLTCTRNATVGADEWIARSELMASPRLLLAVKCRLKEISFVNANTGLGEFRFEIYKNGQLSGNLVYTWIPTATDFSNGYGYYAFTTPLDFNPGDSIFIRHIRASGTSMTDLVLDLAIQQLPD